MRSRATLSPRGKLSSLLSGCSSRSTSSMTRQPRWKSFITCTSGAVEGHGEGEEGGCDDAREREGGHRHLHERDDVELHARVVLAVDVREHVHLLDQLELQRLDRRRRAEHDARVRRGALTRGEERRGEMGGEMGGGRREVSGWRGFEMEREVREK